LRDVGLTSLDMTSLVLAVEAEFSIRIPDRAITPANFMWWRPSAAWSRRCRARTA
jgi:acyl carrier protein